MNKSYLNFSKIVEYKGLLNNPEFLLHSKINQSALYLPDFCELQGKGYITLDLGKEISGGIRIVNIGQGNQKEGNLIRIRFGESLSECYFDIGENNSTNHHSPRDFTYILPDFGTIEVGNTGYRFVRIDFLEDRIQKILSINAVSYLYKDKMIGSFKCEDEVLNNIFNVASRTVHLCMQDYIYDGIKRDRLVWAGDLEPEVHSIRYLFDNPSIVRKTLLFIEKTNPIPNFIVLMPTYNLWYLKCLYEYYLYNGYDSFLSNRKKYVLSTINELNKHISNDGNIDFNPNVGGNDYFIDWRTSNHKDLKKANSCFYLYIFKTVKELLEKMGFENICNEIIGKLEKTKHTQFDVAQFNAFALLSGKLDLTTGYELLKQEGVEDFSTFLASYILEAIAKKDKSLSIHYLKDYFGAMLDLGATTFFEEFEYKWKNNSVQIDELPNNNKFNFLTDSGKDCYVGLRKSLCHGWASNPVQFIIENLVGFKVLEPGYKKIQVKPVIDNFEAKIPSKYGLIIIKKRNGILNIDCSNEIEVTR